MNKDEIQKIKKMKMSKKVIKSYIIDEKTYKDFQIYAIMINKSVSSLIEQFMRETLKEMKKEKKE